MNIRGLIEFVSDVVFSKNGKATSKGLGDHELESEVGWQFGFYSRPNDGSRGIVLKADGQGNTSLLVCYRDRQYELELEKGEVGIANAFDAKILLDKNGSIAVTSKTGQKVTINGSDSAAVMDTLIADLKTWVTTVNTVLGSNATAFGSPLAGYAIPANSAALAAFATSLTPAGAYKSTKVSHG